MAEQHTGYFSGLSDYQNTNDLLVEIREIRDEAVQVSNVTVQAQSVIEPALPAINAAPQAAADAIAASATAVSAANTATSKEALAEKWAENPEDVPVEAGKYSALHWANKAEAVVVDGLDAIFMKKSNNLSDLTDPEQAKVNLNLGTMASQESTAVNITGGDLDGVVITNSSLTSPSVDITGGSIGGSTIVAPTSAIPVTSGGTGGTTAAAARTNLGLGSAATQDNSAFQAANSKLASIASSTLSVGSMLCATDENTFAPISSTIYGRLFLDVTAQKEIHGLVGVGVLGSVTATYASSVLTLTDAAGICTGCTLTRTAVGRYVINLSPSLMALYGKFTTVVNGAIGAPKVGTQLTTQYSVLSDSQMEVQFKNSTTLADATEFTVIITGSTL